MRLLAACIGVLAFAALISARQQPSTARDDDAVRGVVARYVAAREAMDPAAVDALFEPDADQLTSSGEWRRGREAVVKGSLASSEQTGGTRTLTVDRIRYIAGGAAAVADCRYVISGLNGPDRQMWSTILLVREPDAWRISAIRNMLPAAAIQRR